jgi:hypothetical protein
MTAIDLPRTGRAAVDLSDPTRTAAPHEDTADSALALAGSVAEDLLVVVAVSRGRFRPCVETGQRVEAGAVIGHVLGREDRAGPSRADAVRMPATAVLDAFLVADVQSVRKGEALAWGHRTP